MNEKFLSWLEQAAEDIKWGDDSLASGHYAQSCFIAQQIAEKSLKALGFFRGYDLLKSHSLVQIAKELKINGEIEKASRRLDLYYISTRYPDALPDAGVPSHYFGIEQAEEAMLMAKMIHEKCKHEIEGHS